MQSSHYKSTKNHLLTNCKDVRLWKLWDRDSAAEAAGTRNAGAGAREASWELNFMDSTEQAYVCYMPDLA